MAATAPSALESRLLGGSGRQRRIDRSIRLALFACALVSILVTLSIVSILIVESLPFFQVVSVSTFLTDTEWLPIADSSEQRFGILPLVLGTLMVAVGAGVVALPIGLASALFMSEYASQRVRGAIKPIMEILAGIPTIVYGFFAITVITPALESIFPVIGVFNALSASIVVGLMIIPMVASLCEDAFSMVPSSLREGAYALGARKLSVSIRVVFPAALSGVLSSFVLALSRAIGETMAVTLAAGQLPNLNLDYLGPIQTMTAFIVQIAMGDVPHGSLAYQTLFAVALLLFVMTWTMNLGAQMVRRRFSERYG